MRHLPDIFEQARGKWRGVLLTLGVDEKSLGRRHGPCPQCGGTDRFRFTDRDGDGTSICNVCGALSGMQLVQALRGWDFAEAAKEIRQVLGEVEVTAPRRAMSDADRTDKLKRLWKASTPIRKGDPVDVYLAARGVDEAVYPECLRTVLSCPYSASLAFPAMIALVKSREGSNLTLHRTWVQDGDKAPVDVPRKVMPGELNGHGAVRLAEAGEVLGVAEGIETAMAAGNRFGVPTWAALNAGSLKAFDWPETTRELIVFGDHDTSFTGQAAAYTLAMRARAKGLTVTVHIPGVTVSAMKADTDWADEARPIKRDPT